MNPWHLDRELLQRYAAGSTDLPLAGSVETHLIACARCRRLADTAVPTERLVRIWQLIEAGIDAPQPRVIQRILARLRLAVFVPARLIINLSPPLRTLGAMACAMLFLVIAIWVARSFATIDSRHGQTEAVVAASSSPAWTGWRQANLPPPHNVAITAADLPTVASSLVARRWDSPHMAASDVYLKPCLLAAIDRQTVPLAATIALYRHEQAGNVSAAIIVFSGPAESKLDVYVVADDCTGGKGQLIAFQQDIPRANDGYRRTNQNAQALM